MWLRWQKWSLCSEWYLFSAAVVLRIMLAAHIVLAVNVLVAGLPAYAVIIIALACATLVTILASLLFYRWKLQLVDNDDSWKILSSEIQTRDKNETNGSRSIVDGKSPVLETSSRASFARGSRVSGTSYVKVAYYKEMTVAVKPLQANVFHLSPQHLFELKALKQMVHEHIARFHGLCQDPVHPCIVTECCAKGSLTDLLENEAITLDWPFKFSLLNDIVKGLIFVHNSSLKSHGRLTSNNCLIDGRLTVKIGDLGLTTLRPSTTVLAVRSTELPGSQSAAFYALLWRAPEHLRLRMPPNGTAKGDIYSFGILLQQIILRAGPYERPDAAPLDASGLQKVTLFVAITTELFYRHCGKGEQRGNTAVPTSRAQ
ncbi:hypothetical protein RvY_06317-3 [Ramazzottius varieornatus]|uniref:guanylate cyclase n=1 Tax=Ramazzottius varieornatus TaxID=947166 RepID=A0A1D1UYQ5_RAMVA|nr:hypothetical protein RvY_06317-3 [Ramazzottius varieornatus]